MPRTSTKPGVLADFAASQLPLRLVIRQQLLETADVEARLRRIACALGYGSRHCNLESKLNMEVRGKMDQQQKEYYLREKIKAIHDELGDKSIRIRKCRNFAIRSRR